MINYRKMVTEYTRQRPLYRAFSTRIEELIKSILEESNISVHSVASRTKLVDRLDEKISREDKYYTKLTDVTDLSGIRIICLQSEQIENIAEVIKKNFVVLPDLSVDKRKTLDPDRFGYLSLHYVVKLSQERGNLPEYEKYSDLLCEIQIRSILQHAWAEIEHDLGYKSEIAVPRDIRRRFYRLAGLLELADDEFNRVKSDITEYTAVVDKRIRTREHDLAIDYVSLSRYVARSETVKRIDNTIVQWFEGRVKVGGPLPDNRLRTVEFLNIRTIDQLESALEKYSKSIVKFAKKFLAKSLKRHTFSPGISIFYLGSVLSIMRGRDGITQYVDKVAGLSMSPEWCQKLVEHLIGISKTFQK